MTLSSCRFVSYALALPVLVAALAALVAPTAAHAAQGDCSQPVSSGSNPTASDCLFILRTAVGLSTCAPECVCDPNGTGGTSATDALLCLAKAVGQPVALNCPCAADEAALAIVVNPDPARPGEILDVEVTVTNSGTTDLTAVQVDLLLPAEVGDFFLFAARGAAASCVGTFVAGTCSPGETVRWAVGDLDRGETVVLSIPPPVDLDPLPADGTEIAFQATVSAASVQLATEEVSVLVDAARALDLALDEDRDPVAPGTEVLYRLSFGNTGAALSQGTVLRMPLPAGTSFVSASDGGVLGVDDVIEWTLGTLAPGDTGLRTVIVEADGLGLDGGAIAATAEIENQAGELVSAAAATQVTPEVPLVVSLALMPDPVEAGEVIAGTVTVTNTGAVPLLDVTVEVRIPEEITNFFLVDNSGAPVQCLGVFVFSTCSLGEVVQWTVGTLEAGSGISLTMPTPVALATQSGAIVSFEARARDGSGLDVAARESVRVVDPPLFDIAIEDDAEPVAPGGTIRYLVSFGNESGTLGEDPVLRVALPAGVTVVEVSDDGTIDAPGNVVEWTLATFAPGETGTRTIVVEVDEATPDGIIVSAEATVDVLSGERARAVADTRVEADRPLTLALDLYAEPARPGETLSGVLTVTNPGLVQLSDVEVEVMLPQETLDFFLVGNSVGNSDVTVTCAGTFVAGTCSANERVLFSVGTLAAGSGVVLTTVPKIKSDVPAGSVVTFAARARAGNGVNVTANRLLRVEDERQLDLSFDDGDGDPALAASTTIYRLSYGNPTAVLAEGVALDATLPDSVSFVDASDGGTVLPDGTVRWLLEPIAPGETGTRDLVLDIGGELVDGDVVRVEAEIDDANGRTRAVVDTRVEDGVPLLLTMELGPEPVLPGKTVQAVLTATNAGPVPLLGVEVEVLLPQESGDFFAVGNSGATSVCAGTFVAGTCSRDERMVFAVGTLAAGAGITLTSPVLVADTTAAGTVMTLEARGRATGGVNTAARGSVRVEAERLLDVSIDDGAGDSVPAGGALEYTINFGNPTAAPADNTVLSMFVPVGTTFVAASDGGAVDSAGLVTWDVGTLSPGDVGTRTLTVDADEGLIDGAILRASVQMDDSSGRRTNAQSDTRVGSSGPLTLTLELAPDEAAVGDAIVGTLVVTNTGLVTLSGVEVEVLLPEEEANFQAAGATGATVVCAGTFVAATCSAGERVVFTVGNLVADGEATLTFPPGILAGTPAGSQVVFEARARATGGANAALRDTVRVVAP